MTETIIAAALLIQLPEATPDIENDPMIFSKPRPARHHHLIHEAASLIGRPVRPMEQGFLTSSGRYVDRVEAARIALTAGQDTQGRVPVYLFSEDLW